MSARSSPHQVTDVAGDELGALAACTEGDGAVPALDEAGHDRCGLGGGGAAHARRRVEHRRVEQREQSPSTRRAVVGDLGDVEPTQRRRQFARSADGGRGEHEGRVGSVVVAQPAEAPHQVRHVGAEHAAQHVELVDDDVAEPPQEPGPAAVVGQDAGMEHLGVGEDHVGVAADPAAVLAACVAVVGGGHEAADPQRAERSQLVLGEGLGGEQAHRGAGAHGVGDGLGDGYLIAERLARRRAGGDDDRAFVACEIDGRCLMGPEAQIAERVRDAAGEGTGELGMAGGAFDHRLDVDDASVVDQVVEHRRQWGALDEGHGSEW